MAGHLPRLVPWASRGEWEDVRAWLFSRSADDRRRACARVAAWRSRGKLPVAIDCTAALVSVRLSDPHSVVDDGEGEDVSHVAASAGGFDDTSLRMSYAMCLVRFVNGIVDGAQSGIYAKSVSGICERLGIADWVVDVRHEATHTGLPSVAALRLASAAALAWLRERYWVPQRAHIESSLSRIRDGLLVHRAELRGIFKNGAKGDSAAEALEAAQSAAIALVRTVAASAVRDTFVPTLLEPGVMMPVSDVRLLGLDATLVLDQRVMSRWAPSLRTFSAVWAQFVPALFCAIVDELCMTRDGMGENGSARGDGAGERDAAYRGCVAALGARIVEDALAGRPAFSSSQDAARGKQPVDGALPLWHVVDACERLPSPYLLPMYASALVATGATPSEADARVAVIRWGSIPAEIVALVAKTCGALGVRVPTAEGQKGDVVAASCATEQVVKGASVTDGGRSVWSRLSEREAVRWRSLGLGALPGGALPSLDLPAFVERGHGSLFITPVQSSVDDDIHTETVHSVKRPADASNKLPAAPAPKRIRLAVELL